MKDRVKELRKTLGLTQSDFGMKIGLTRDGVAAYERGIANPTPAAIMLMCKEFQVNEQWLRSGEGEMFVKLSVEDELAAYMGKVFALPKDDPRYRIIMAMAKIPEQYWPTIREIMDIMASEVGKKA